MKKVIYTKYSTERSDKFKIATSILKEEDGSVYVKKKPAHEKAQSHIEGLLSKYEALKEYYNKSEVEFASCEIAEGNAVFPFVEGESLEGRLDRYIEDKDYKGILQEIENYKRVITDNLEIVPFRVCDDFIGVFGANYPEEGVDAFKVSDIDLIFSNIIISGDKWQVIDYEWTFNFPVPVDYVVYRAVMIYSELCTRRLFLAEDNIYAFLGMNERQTALYSRMEHAFQLYVSAAHMPIGELYQSIGGKNVSLKDIIDKNINFDRKNEIQVFYDYGEGVCEENSYKVYKEYDNPKELEIEVGQGIKMLRVDPAIDFCIVKVIDALGNLGGFYELEISTNGIDIGEGCFAFSTQDPQIYLQGIKENTDRVIVKFAIQLMDKSVAYTICKAVAGLYGTIKQLSIDNQEKQDIINHLSVDNQEKQNVIDGLSIDNQRKQEIISATTVERDALLASTSWKITKPYRFIAGGIKKVARVFVSR